MRKSLPDPLRSFPCGKVYGACGGQRLALTLSPAAPDKSCFDNRSDGTRCACCKELPLFHSDRMSNKQRRGWRPWAFVSVIAGPPLVALLTFFLSTDRSSGAFVREFDRVAVSLWFVLFAIAWLRAKKQESRAQGHARTLRSRADLEAVSGSLVAVDASLVRAQEDLWTVEVLLQMLFVVFGVLRLVDHYLEWLAMGPPAHH